MYGSKTLLGNFSEDRTHAELLAKDYQLKKQRGELLTLKQQRQESIMMQTVRCLLWRDLKIRFCVWQHPS